MCKIDENPLCLHSSDEFTTKIGKTAFLDAMRRTTCFVVEEMSDANHSHTGIVKPIKILNLSFKCVRSFDAKKTGSRTASSILEIPLNIGRRP